MARSADRRYALSDPGGSEGEATAPGSPGSSGWRKLLDELRFKETRPIPYSQAVQGWHDFYLTAGAAAAALAGLLFVGLSIHLQAVLSHPDVKGLARVTLTNFFAVLLISLFVLIPASAPLTTGVAMLTVGVLSVALSARAVVGALRRRALTLGFRLLLFRFGLSILAYLVVSISGLLFLFQDAGDGLGWLVSAIVMLLITAVRNTWDLLITVGEHRMTGGRPADDRTAAAGSSDSSPLVPE